MATNPLIALQTKGLDTAKPTRDLINMRLQSEQVDMQRQQAEREEQVSSLREQKLAGDVLQQRYEQQDAQNKRRLRNTALASAQLQRVLDSEGKDAALQWLQNNQEGNDKLGLPSEDTQEAIQMLQEGKTDQLRTHLDNNVYVGESLGLIEQPERPAQWEPIYDDRGNVIGQRNTQTGKVSSDPRAPDLLSEEELAQQERIAEAGGTNVTVGGEKFSGESGKLRARRVDEMINTGRKATGTEQQLSQMGDLLVEGVQTGTLQPAVTTIQGLAEDMGVDVSSAAEAAGIENLSNLSGKEEFDRLAKQVIIDGFEKFKGNLNDREVKLAMDAFANLGKSEEANVEAISSLMASQSMAKERGRRAAQVENNAEARALEAEMFDDSLERFKALKKGYEEDIRSRMQENQQSGPTKERAAQQGGTVEVDEETQRLLEKYQ